jgi:tetratricopeptide (TPR) repeat protein
MVKSWRPVDLVGNGVDNGWGFPWPDVALVSFILLFAVFASYLGLKLARRILFRMGIGHASLSREHLHVLARSDRAAAYQEAGRLDRALREYEAALAYAEKVLGPDHPDTLMVRNNIATVYQDAGNLDEAVRLYEAILADAEQKLGPNHPDTLMVRNNIACANHPRA